MNTLFYILQVSGSWFVLFGFYHFFLRKETFFDANRWYLLFALIAGLIMPLILPVFRGAFEANVATLPTYVLTLDELIIGENNINIDAESTFWIWQNVGWSIYILGLLYFTGRFFKGIFNIIKIKKSGKTTTHHGYSIIKTAESISPFSFGKWLFLPEKSSLSLEEERQIIEHELVHIQSKHSWDIMIIECISILFWFNPLLMFFRNALKEVHEYAADKVVLKKVPVKYYGQLLLQQAFPNVELALIHKFSQSQLKKRIKMMTQKPSSKTARAKYLFIVPLLLLLLVTFSAYKYAENLVPVIPKEDLIEATISSEKEASLPSISNENNLSKQTISDSIYQGKNVDEMPLLLDCMEEAKEDRYFCSDSKILRYVYKEVQYPEEARKAGLEGLIVVSFVVDKKGKIDKIKLRKDIGKGCGKEVERIVKVLANDSSMKWKAGVDNGKKVNVQINLPVRFRLKKKE